MDESDTLNDGFYCFRCEDDIPQAIHNGGCNLAFCDGRAKWVPKAALYQKGTWAHEDWFWPWAPHRPPW